MSFVGTRPEAVKYVKKYKPEYMAKKQIMELLLLVIPFEDTGAMETFLLNAIANDSAYDAEIIRKGNQFVEEVDKERRYLTKRR